MDLKTLAEQVLARNQREQVCEQQVNKVAVHREQSVNTAAVHPERGINMADSDAVLWLRAKLASGPQHIAPLVAEWVGTLDHPTGRDVDDLMAARWTLGVHAYIGDDDRFWWTLPGEWSLWPCEHCGNPAEVEDVGPSLDGQRTLTHWYCSACQTWGTTPDTLREPPVWVLRTVH